MLLAGVQVRASTGVGLPVGRVLLAVQENRIRVSTD